MKRRSPDLATGVLGAVAAAVGMLVIPDLWFLLFPLAGIVVGSLARDRVAGLLGLLGGILIGSLAWGTMTVTRQIQSCQPDCGGLSSPAITVAIVIVVALAVEAITAGGFLLGRLVRRIVGVEQAI
jgi:hypothetical protein